MSIKSNVNRFKHIVKGIVRENLHKYLSEDEMVGKKENEFIKIPIPRIDIPNFRYGSKNDEQGVGNGNQQEGESLDADKESGSGKAGKDQGEHTFEAEFSVSELAQILGEKLSLPKIEPKGRSGLNSEKNKYNLIAPIGPEGLKHFKSSYKKALQRSISSGVYDPKNPVIIPNKEDMRYKSFKEVKKPEHNAVIFYIMDISGSMGNDQKKLVQHTIFWINAWLSSNYKGINSRFIVHESVASEVTEKQFFTISANGGTLISSGYQLCKEIIEKEYPVEDWNIYVFHFSDGDNWSSEDSRLSIKIIKEFFLPIVNSFNYGQIDHSYGSGDFFRELNNQNFPLNFVKSRFKDKEGILNIIKEFLGKGK